jgi:RimJ/RimL family protein N-acetyltransferase
MLTELFENFIKKYEKKPYTVEGVTIQFEHEGENELHAYIDTPRLELASTQLKDKDFYNCLCGNSTTMELYGTGNPWTPEYVTKRITEWLKLWQADIPFSSFVATLKESPDGKPVGHIALDYDQDTPVNTAEISYIFDNYEDKIWGQGYASEAVWAVVNPYSDEINKKPYLCRGQPYTGVYGTARPDNPRSVTVLLKSGLDIKQKDGIPISTQWGKRLTFFKEVAISANDTSLKELLPNTSQLVPRSK